MSLLQKVPKVTSIDYYFDIVSIPAWVLFERFSILKETHKEINFNFRPVHAGNLFTTIGVQVPYTTPNLKKNYFEEQRLFARLHGLNIRTDPVEQFWQRLWVENKALSSQKDLEEALNSSQICLDFDLNENSFSNDEWCNKLNENHREAVEAKFFGIPWTVLHFEKDLNSRKEFFGIDSWPLICQYLKIPQKLFGDVLLF
uniref:DSBA-like thioredoxin domain-containing protein n=1 Tax=Meloidogyne javanica TaxID=6303 RepID=A0A915MY55_MELJA